MSAQTLQTYLSHYPQTREVVIGLKKQLSRTHSRKLQFIYLRQCKEECVTPKSLMVHRLKEIRKGEFGILENELLNIHIKNARKEKELEFKKLYKCWRQFDNVVPDAWKIVMSNYMGEFTEAFIEERKEDHRRKLDILIFESNWYSLGSDNNYVNYSDKVLSENEIIVLRLGMKFNNPTNKPDIISIIKSVQQKMDYSSEDESNNLKIVQGIIYGAFMKVGKYNFFPLRLHKALLHLKKDRTIHICRADKSKTIVILNNVNYENKMLELLNDNNTYQLLRKNPLNSVKTNFRKSVKIILDTIDRKDAFTDKMCNYSNQITLPYMYGTIKTHKNNLPARPVISTVGSIEYKLSKFLVNLLQPLVGTISTSHVKNSVEFVHKLNNLNNNLNNCTMISFDVSSLFTNVPVNEVLDFLKNELERYCFSLPVFTIIELIKLCVVGTCFKFKNSYYKQISGMGMGNCLSPILANIYMEFYETRIANQLINETKIWIRYVDDCFALIPENMNINYLLQQFNNLHNKIQFTVENEENKTLPFLDVTVIRGDHFKYKIYRKQTNNNLVINNFSQHRESIKHSALISMFLRALRICSPEFIDEEYVNISNIGKLNHFSDWSMEICLQKAKNTFYNINNKEPFDFKKAICIPYHPNFDDIIHPIRQMGYNLVFSYKDTIGKKLIKNSPVIDQGVIYKVPCGCGKYYLGETCQLLSQRVNQHKYDEIKNPLTSAMLPHSSKCQCPMLYNQTKILFKNSTRTGRHIIEAACIQLSKYENINTHPGRVKLDPISLHIIEKQYKIKDTIKN